MFTSEKLYKLASICAGALLVALVFAGWPAERADAADPPSLTVNNGGTCSDVTGDPYCTIQTAITAAGPDGAIIVSPGVYTEDLIIPAGKDGLEIWADPSYEATIKGVANRPIGDWPAVSPNIEILSKSVILHRFTIEHPAYEAGHYASGIVIGASDVRVAENHFKVLAGATTDEISQAIQTYHENAVPGVDISGLDISSNTFTNLNDAEWGYEGIYVNRDAGADLAYINDNQMTGKVFRGITCERSKCSILENRIITDLPPTDAAFSTAGAFQGINVRDPSGTAQSDVTVGSNVVQGNTEGQGFLQGIRVGQTGQTLTNFDIHDNNVQLNTMGVNVKAAAGVTINENDILNNTTGVQNDNTDVSLNAERNWWDDATGPGHSTNESGLGNPVSDDVDFIPWYSSSGKTTVTYGSTDAVYTGVPGSGAAILDTGVTDIALNDDTAMDVHGGMDTAAGGHINVGGHDKTLSDFTSGDLAGVDLSVEKTVGSATVIVDKAVQLQSGINGEPIVLTNTDYGTASVSIPDGTTVMGPAGWTGTLKPPKGGSATGTAPSSFTVGDTVIEVGSPDGILLFDQPVSVIIDGVQTYVGYRPTGSTVWTQITQNCGGTYANPTAPAFPGACFITDGGLNKTKIYTYHFTAYGNLNAVATQGAQQPSGSGGGGGGGPSAPPANSNTATSTTPSAITKTVDKETTYSRPLAIASNMIVTNAVDGTKTAPLTGELGKITLMPNKASTVDVVIPANTTVTSTLEWDGKIEPPIVQSITRIPAMGATITGTKDTLTRDAVAAIVKIGSNKATLNFSNPVTLEVPVDLPDGSKVKVYISDRGYEYAYLADATVVGGKAVVTTAHFSYLAFTKTAEGLHGAAPAEAAKVAFMDIVGHWANQFIKKLAAAGIVSGKTKVRFAPNDMITRAEVIKIAMSAFNYPIPESVTEKPANDIPVSAWYAPYIAAAQEAGVIEDMKEAFGPDTPATRAFALTVMLRAAGFTDIDANFDTNYKAHPEWGYVFFQDVPMGEWFAKFVGYAKDKGIVGGYSDGTFRPANPITRAEVSKITVKMMDMK